MSGGTAGGKFYRWHYDDTGYYAYILLDGDEQIKNVICRRLRTRGIEALLSGEDLEWLRRNT